ncbi:O-antigen ligase family protein [Luteimonas chenhongjianii]|nr:O-antigen ligase family protein [Luteimonas chenhongjianii]
MDTSHVAIDAGDVAATGAVCALLTVALLGGGSSQQAGLGLDLAAAMAVPLLAWGVWRWLDTAFAAVPTAWLSLLALVAVLPLLQLLPLPAGWGGEGRRDLNADLATLGVAQSARWSLAPGAVTAAMLSLLPAAAVFVLTLSLRTRGQRAVLAAVVGLAMASLLLGVAQLGAPQESVLNPYPQWAPAMNGFFANPNHQATLLVIAATLACAGTAHALVNWQPGRPRRALTVLACVVAMLLSLTALPLTGSRAGIVLVILALGMVVALQWPHWRGSRRGRLALAGGLAVAIAGLLTALRWMRVDAVDELRAPLRAATSELATRFSPLGGGVGSYVPIFEQEAPRSLLMSEYVNHAHNEYLQWSLEAGFVAIALMLAGAMLLVATFVAIQRQPPGDRMLSQSALLGLLVVLAHSLVDYPMRTPALLAIAAALAGIAASASFARPGVVMSG